MVVVTRLRNTRSWVRFPSRTMRVLSSAIVQTVSGAYSASDSVVTEGSFPGCKADVVGIR